MKCPAKNKTWAQKGPGSEENEKDSAYRGLQQNAEHESPGGSLKRKTRKQRKAQHQKDSYHRSKNEKIVQANTRKMKVSQQKLNPPVQGLTYIAKPAFQPLHGLQNATALHIACGGFLSSQNRAVQ